MSTLESVYIGGFLLWICQLGSLATWHSAHVGLCPLLVLSILGSAHVWLILRGILSTWVFDYLDSVHLGVCPYDSQSTKLSSRDMVFQTSSGSPLVLSLFEPVQLGVCLPGFCPLWSLATWHSLQAGLCPLLVLSNLDCAHFWFCLLGSQSTWVVVYMESVHSGVWPHDSQSTKFSAHDKVFQISLGWPWALSFFWVCPTWCLSSWFLSTLESGHMTFSPNRIVSTICSVNSAFCSRLAYSTWDSIYLGVFLLGICPLESLATWHSAHVAVCPLMVLSTLDSAHVWFCLLRSLCNWVFVYLNSIYLGSLATWHSAHLGLCQLLYRWTLDSTYVWFYLL